MKQTAVHWSIGLTSHVPCVFSRNHWPWSTLGRQARLRLSTPCAKAPWFEVIGCKQSKLKKKSVSFWVLRELYLVLGSVSSQYGLLLKAQGAPQLCTSLQVAYLSTYYLLIFAFYEGKFWRNCIYLFFAYQQWRFQYMWVNAAPGPQGLSARLTMEPPPLNSSEIAMARW